MLAFVGVGFSAGGLTPSGEFYHVREFEKASAIKLGSPSITVSLGRVSLYSWACLGYEEVL